MKAEGLERDNIHFNISEVDGYNKPINFIISPREPGKTTTMTLDRLYAPFKNNRLPAVVLVNQAADALPEYLESFEKTVNDFKGYEIHTKISTMKDSVATIREKETDLPWIYVVAVGSAPITRLKRLNFGRVSCVWYDECNVNVSVGEKWPKSLAVKWNELYTTLARHNYPQQLKFYATGNFYTRYNPLMTYLGVPCEKLEIGRTLTGDKWVVKCVKLTDELRNYILKVNPGYTFDDTYERYFRGEAIADSGISIINKKPEGFSLKYCFKIGNRYLYAWVKGNTSDADSLMWIEASAEQPGKKRRVFVTDISQSFTNAILISINKHAFGTIKNRAARGLCSFNTPEAFYMLQEIYSSF